MRRELSANGGGRILDGTRDERAPAWGRLPGLGGGIFWCSHCSSWRPFAKGSADDCERFFGPVCDDCAATSFRGER